MKGRILFILFIFTSFNAEVFASGKKDADNVITKNDEWILCITNFETKSLPLEKAVVVPVIKRKIIERINMISYRTRISPEYAYYEEYAWVRERATAAKAIATKMDERSSEIYKGNPKWRYNQNIAKIDKDLIKLRKTLEEVESSPPVINKEPVFKLSKGNDGFNFPAAPASGGELTFCMAQSSDALLSGAIVDFHGRFLLSLKLYISYTRSFVWEDRIAFSEDDIDAALDDILQKLMIVLAGNEPAIVSITAQPEDALVLINRSFAGKGSTGNLEYPPSTIIVTAASPNHETVTLETTLSASEKTNININLAPIQYEDVNILGDEGSRIYKGALYIGKAPYTLRLPVNSIVYIEMEKPYSDNSGKIVFEIPDKTEVPSSFQVKTRPPLKSNSVDRNRRIYYWSWGATWITGIFAWIAGYTYKEASDANLMGYNTNTDEVQTWSYIRIGAYIGLGVAGVYTVYRLIRYLITANRDATPIVKPLKVKKSEESVENTEDNNVITVETADVVEGGE